MLHGGFLRRGQLLDNVGVMATHSHRVAITHGRADYVCQPQAAWRLSEALRAAGCKNVELEFVAGAGHSDSEPGLVDAMVRATERFKAPASPVPGGVDSGPRLPNLVPWGVQKWRQWGNEAPQAAAHDAPRAQPTNAAHVGAGAGFFAGVVLAGAIVLLHRRGSRGQREVRFK